MVHKRDQLATRCKAEMADPSTTLVKNLTDGELQPAMSVDMVNDRQLTLRIPIGPAYVFQQFTRGPAGHGSTRQRSACEVKECAMAPVKLKRQLILRRQRQ